MAEILSSPSSYSDEYKCDDSYLPVPDPIIEDPDNPEGDEEYYSYLHSGDEYEDEDEDGWGSLPEGEDILDIWEKKHAHLHHATNLEDKRVPYMGDLSQTIIFALVSGTWTYREDGFPLDPVPNKSTVQLFAVDASDGTLYQLTTRTFDYEYVDYAIQGEIVHFIDSSSHIQYQLNSRENLTYNLLTMNWNSHRLPFQEAKSRLWSDGFPAYQSFCFYGLAPESKWRNYFSGCIVGDVAFRFLVKETQPFLSVASLDHIAQDDANFVPPHTIPFDHDCFKGVCSLDSTKCFLNHITGLKFCLLIFFQDYVLYFCKMSVCILNIELAKETETETQTTRRIQSDPDQYIPKARKLETNRFKIQSILNKRAFELPPNRFPASCVKQENGESSKLQLKARKYIIN